MHAEKNLTLARAKHHTKFRYSSYNAGVRGAQLAEALRYNREGSGFDSR
jgi:hypothetical protein